MPKSDEERTAAAKEKEAECKANGKFLDKVIIHMLVSITVFTVAWTVLNAFNIAIQTEVIIGFFAFWGAEGGISCIIKIKKKVKDKEKEKHEKTFEEEYSDYTPAKGAYNVLPGERDPENNEHT